MSGAPVRALHRRSIDVHGCLGASRCLTMGGHLVRPPYVSADGTVVEPVAAPEQRSQDTVCCIRSLAQFERAPKEECIAEFEWPFWIAEHGCQPPPSPGRTVSPQQPVCCVVFKADLPVWLHEAAYADCSAQVMQPPYRSESHTWRTVSSCRPGYIQDNYPLAPPDIGRSQLQSAPPLARSKSSHLARIVLRKRPC